MDRTSSQLGATPCRKYIPPQNQKNTKSPKDQIKIMSNQHGSILVSDSLQQNVDSRVLPVASVASS
jgi:hypothetical protein